MVRNLEGYVGLYIVSDSIMARKPSGLLSAIIIVRF